MTRFICKKCGKERSFIIIDILFGHKGMCCEFCGNNEFERQIGSNQSGRGRF